MLTSTLLHKYKLTLVAASVTFLFACAGPDNQTENKQAETPEQATEREVVKSDSVTQTKTTVSRIHIAEQHAIGKANKNPNLKVPDYYIRLHNENYDSKDKKLLFKGTKKTPILKFAFLTLFTTFKLGDKQAT